MLTGEEIRALVGKGIQLQPSEAEDQIRSTYIQLTAARVVLINMMDIEDGLMIERAEREVNLEPGTAYSLRPGEFVLAEAAERVVLSTWQLVGTFDVVSEFNDSGVLVQCGRLSPIYGGPLRFGLFNASDCAFSIKAGLPLVRLSLWQLETAVEPQSGESDRQKAIGGRRLTAQVETGIEHHWNTCLLTKTFDQPII